jgi:hypothetical protein
VDCDRRFLDVEIGWPGSVADRRIFDKSLLNTKYEQVLAALGRVPLATGPGITEEFPAFILGDSAYPNTRHFVTTYKITEYDADPAIRKLNQLLSKARCHVEHAFGLIKGRFKILEKPLKCAAEDFPFSMHLIASIFVMHNFLIDTHDQNAETGDVRDIHTTLNEEIVDSEDDLENNGEEGTEQSSQGNTREALLRRIRWSDSLL